MDSEAIMIGLLLSWRDSRTQQVVCLMIMTVKWLLNCYGQFGNCDLLVTARFFQQVALLTVMALEIFDQ